MMYKKNNNNINKGNKRPRIKIKDFYKIYENREINENNKSSKRNELNENKNKNKYKNIYNNNNFNSFSDNNNSNRNKSGPKLNNDNNDNRENVSDENLNESNNNYFIDLNSKNSNQSYNSKNIKIYMNNFYPNNNILNSSNSGKKSNDINSNNEVNNKNNYDYNGDNFIFTRITPNFVNKSNEEIENDSSIPYLNQTKYNSKTNKTSSYMDKKILNNSNNIYIKNKSPYGRYIYHNKKRIVNIINNNEVNFPDSLYHKNINNYENYIEGSPRIYRNQKANEIDDKKKIYFILKNGIKLKLDKNEENDYIDLLTIDEINNLEKIQSKKLVGKAILPFQDNQTNNLNKLSLERNIFRNDNIEINDNWQKRNNYFLEKQFDDNGKIKIIGKKRENKIRNKNRSNKSYDNMIFNRKTGLNKRKRNNRRNNSPDIIDEDIRDKKGTPIKKEDDKGGIVVLYPNYLKSKKSTEINEDNKDIIFTIVYLQRWWKKIYYNYIKKIIIIQKIFKRYYFRKKNNKIIHDIDNDNDNCYKILKINNCYITKAYYKLTYNKTKKFRDYSNRKNSNEFPLKSDRIANEIVVTPNKNLNDSNNESSSKEKKNINNFNDLNNNINNNAHMSSNIEQSFQNKKHRYTGSKLTPMTINNILLNECEIRYETNHYTFLKKCQLRRPRFVKDDDDEEKSERPLTCEIMRKINTNLNSKNVTPDTNRNKKIITNNSLEKINLLNIEFINEKKNKKNQKSFFNNNDHKNFNKNNSKDNNRNSKMNLNNNINIKYKNNQVYDKGDKNGNSIKSSNLTGSNYNNLNINNNTNNNNSNNTKNNNDINNGSSYNKNSIDFDDINSQNLDNIKTFKTIYSKKNSEDLINNNFDLNKIRTISTVDNNKSNNISKNSQLNDNNININKNSIESNNHFQNSINNNSNNSSKLKNKNDKNINEKTSKNGISNDDDINQQKENENLEKIILIQRNIRKFLQKRKPSIIKVKRTSLQSKKSTKKSKNLKKNDLHGTSSFTNSKFHLNSKKNSYKSNKKVSFKDSSKGIENSFSNLEYSHSSEQNNDPDDDDNEIGRKNNDTDSLKSISINKDFLESIRNNGSSVNNSIFLKNSVYSINSIDNNIRKYLNNFNSNYDSNIDKSKTNSIYEDSNYLINPNGKINNRISKINSSSLKSIKYKYNKIYYEEYLKFLLKENYICYAASQLKNMGMYYKYYKLIYILKMIEQRIIKVVHQFVFFIIKGVKNDNKTNIFFNVLKIYIKNINIVISENNNITKLLKDEIEYYSKVYQKYKYVPYIRPNDENKLINCQLFNKDDEFNELINFVCSYLNFEKQLKNISSELVKSYIGKNPLKNYNIFAITRYIDSLYNNVIAFK